MTPRLRRKSSGGREEAGGGLGARQASPRSREEELLISHRLLGSGVRARTKELRASLASLVSLSQDMICLAGTDGSLRRVNAAFQRILGHSEEDLLSRPLVEFIHPEDVAETLAEVGKLASGRPTAFFENRWLCAGGGYKHVEWMAESVIEEGLIYAIGRDISDRRRAEEAERLMASTRREMEIAREIQQSLLPSSAPPLGGYDLAAASLPSRDVGGDYFDFLPMPSGRLGLVIGDATGHGIGSALLMTQTRASLWSLVAAGCDSVEEILRRANGVLHAATPDNRFVTLTLVDLDPDGRSIRYGSCGHTTGYILDAGGAVRAAITSTGFPLGCVPDCELSAGRGIALEAGDLLLLITDGVTDAASPQGELFGAERAVEVVRALRHEPAARIVDGLQRAVLEFHSSDADRDDISAIVLKVLDRRGGAGYGPRGASCGGGGGGSAGGGCGGGGRGDGGNPGGPPAGPGPGGRRASKRLC